MRFTVTSNGFTRVDLILEDFASIVSQVEYEKIKKLEVGQTYERKPFAGQSGTYEFKVERTK